MRLRIRLAGKINSGGGWKKTWSLNVPNKGLQNRSQTLLSTSRLTTANGFLFKTLPNRKKGLQCTSDNLCTTSTVHGLLNEASKENHISIRGGKTGWRERGWRRIKMQMGWLIKWQKDINEPMLLTKVIFSLNLRLTFSNLPTKAAQSLLNR